MHWQEMDNRERRAHLARLDDDEVISLARAWAKRRGTNVGALLTNWVLNGYLSRTRKLRMEGARNERPVLRPGGADHPRRD